MAKTTETKKRQPRKGPKIGDFDTRREYLEALIRFAENEIAVIDLGAAAKAAALRAQADILDPPSTEDEDPGDEGPSDDPKPDPPPAESPTSPSRSQRR